MSHVSKSPLDIFGTVVGESPDCLLLSGTVVGENPDHVCWEVINVLHVTMRNKGRVLCFGYFMEW